MNDLHTISLSDSTKLHFQIDGPVGAPWVVFSNSVMTDLSVWDDQMPALTERYRVLRYNQRGHGRSDTPKGAMTFTNYGADLVAVMDAAGVDRAALIGLSMGCPTALAAIDLAPQRITAFIAVDGVAKSAPGREAFWAERRDTAQAQGMGVIAQQTAARWLPGIPDDAPSAIRLRQMIGATSVEGFAAATHALASYDHSDTSLLCPVLAIAGEEDGAMPDAMQRQFGNFPDAHFAVIPKAGHLPNLQCPDAFNTVLVAFLNDHVFPSDKETI